MLTYNITDCEGSGDKEGHDINLKRFTEAVDSFNLAYNHNYLWLQGISWVLLFLRVKLNHILKDIKEHLRRDMNSLHLDAWKLIENAVVQSINEMIPSFMARCVHQITLATTLNKASRQVASFSRTWKASEQKHSAIEKGAYAIVLALCKWWHYFTLLLPFRNQLHSCFILNSLVKLRMMTFRDGGLSLLTSPGERTLLKRFSLEHTLPLFVILCWLNCATHCHLDIL